jgi:hypothetical protein
MIRDFKMYARPAAMPTVEGLTLNKVLWATFVDDQGMTVYVYGVDGEYIADQLDVGWAGGGHGYIDTFTPRNEIWLEQDYSDRRRLGVLQHEIAERMAMRDDKPYTPAHHNANEAEAQWRRATYNVPSPHIGD